MPTKLFYKKRVCARCVVVLLLLLLVSGLMRATQDLHAQAGGSYEIVRSAITTAATAQGGPYQVDVTVGQSEVGVQSGGSYDLGGGFWGDTTPDVAAPPATDESLYLPLIVR